MKAWKLMNEKRFIKQMALLHQRQMDDTGK